MQIVNALDAEAVAVDAEGFPSAEAREIEGAWVDFHGDFDVRRKSVVGFESAENAIDLVRREQRRRSATEKECFQRGRRIQKGCASRARRI